jgi:beta-lactam-binding protein with PASTA domain
VAELGRVLAGRYRLEQVLGQGGMATIFRATDSKLGREVAVKVLRPEFGSDAQFVERFRHEAQAAASLSHPNIVQVYDFGTDPAGPYIVMEQVTGGDLSVALGEHGALPPTAVARIGQQVADALAAAHARGLIHRDIKPGNILLSPDGRVQVADFGIAHVAARSPVTSTGITLGSVLYFSPEQARGDTASPASDIYSLGLVLYELLTGQRPFSGDSPAAVAVARLSGSVPSPTLVRADTPPALDAIVRWCLAIDPAARPSASELSMALTRFVADPSGAAAFAAVGAVPGAGVPAPIAGSMAPGQPVPGSLGQPAVTDPGHSRSGPLAWAAAGLGLLVIVASGILLFVLFSGIGDSAAAPSPTPTSGVTLVRTPQLVGRTESDAANVAGRRGLVVEADYVASASEVGLVIEQLPGPGVQVPSGTSIQVMVGTAVETVVVPDVHGIKEDGAIAQLEAAGLKVGMRYIADDLLPQGYVITTDPGPGESLTRNSAVDYVISTGRGLGATAAPASTPRPVSTLRPRVKPSPFPSQRSALVGDFLCLTLAEARGHIEEAELLLGAVIPSDPAPPDDWLVHDQLPKAGAMVPVGSNVDLVLGDPQTACP